MTKRAASEHDTPTTPANSSTPSAGLWPITFHQVRTPAVSERTGKGRLMRAVLEDAIASLRRYRGARDARERRLFELERAWFTRDDARQPFAFATVCNALDLDRASLRRIAQVWEFETAEPAEPPWPLATRRASAAELDAVRGRSAIATQRTQWKGATLASFAHRQWHRPMGTGKVSRAPRGEATWTWE